MSTPSPQDSNTLDLPPAPPATNTLAPRGLATDAPTLAQTEHAESIAPPVYVPGYEILGELGRGGMGVVYKARQTQAGRLVALKMILSGAHAGEADRARFRTEAQAIARLTHPNIVGVYEVSEHEGRPFFSMEFCAGGSLEKLLGGTPLPPVQAATLIEALARAMNTAHAAGVVHRDLTTANVLLAVQGPTVREGVDVEGPTGREGVAASEARTHALPHGRALEPKITDFGLAKRLDEQGQTVSGAIMGTPSYMAPEQAEAKKDVGPAADIYALGAILYECLTGRPPFRAATAFDTLRQVLAQEPVPPRVLNPGVPPDLETIALKCLQKAPERRYVRAADLADDLGRFLRNEPIQARPVSTIERGVKWVRRRPAMAGLILTCAAALLAVLGISVAFNVRLQHEKRNVERERDEADFQRREADAQRKQAQENFRLARQAVDEYAKKAAEDPRLKERGVQEVRREWLQAAQKFYEKFVQQAGDDPDIRLEQARAHSRLASISAEISTPDDAEKRYKEAQQMWERLLVDHPQKDTIRSELAQIHHDLAGVARARGQIAVAEKLIFQSHRMREELDRDYPGRFEYRAAIGASHNQLGLFFKDANQPARAIESFQTAIRLLEKLKPSNDAEREMSSITALAWLNLGNVYQLQDQFPQAEDAYRRAAATFDERTRHSKLTSDHRKLLAMMHVSRAFLYQKMEDAEQTGKCYQAALPLFRELVEEQPHVLDMQNSLATTLMMLGVHTMNQGKPREAAGYYDQASYIQDRLYRNHPTVKQYQTNRFSGLLALSTLYFGTRQAQKCEETLDKALTAGRELVQAHPDNPEMKSKLADIHVKRRKLFEAIDQRDRAAAEFAREMPLREELAKSGEPDYRAALAGCCNNYGLFVRAANSAEAMKFYNRGLGILSDVLAKHPAHENAHEYRAKLLGNRAELIETRQPAAALADRREVQAYYQRLVCAEPHSIDHRRSLAVQYRKIGEALVALGRLPEAEAAYRQEFALYDDALSGGYKDDEPSTTRTGLARSAARLGTFYRYRVKDRAAESEAYYRKSIVHYTWLAMMEDEPADHYITAGGESCNLAHLYNERLAKPREAQAWYARAEWLLGQALEIQPDNATASRYLRNVYAGRSGLLTRIGQPKDAISDLQRVIRYHEVIAAGEQPTPRNALELANAWDALATTQYDLKELSQAATSFMKAADICAKIQSDKTHGIEARILLARSSHQRGRLRIAEGKFADAVPLLQQARQTRETLLEGDDSDRRDLLEPLCLNLELLATAHYQTKERGKAIEVQREAATRRRQLLTLYPNYPTGHVGMAKAYAMLGLLEYVEKTPEKAARSLEQACEAWEAFSKVGPPALVKQHLPDLATAYSGLVEVHLNRKDYAAVEKVGTRAMPVWQRLLAEPGATPAQKVNAGGMACNIGHARQHLKKTAEALEAYDLAIETLTAVRAADAKNATAREYLRNSHVGRAMARMANKDLKSALEDLDVALTLAATGEDRVSIRLERATVLAKLNRPYQALAETIDAAKTEKLSGSTLVRAAVAYLHVSTAIQADARIPLPHREKQAETAARHALAQLERARTAGYFDTADNRKSLDEADLADLRRREDYQVWRKKLE